MSRYVVRALISIIGFQEETEVMIVFMETHFHLISEEQIIIHPLIQTTFQDCASIY